MTTFEKHMAAILTNAVTKTNVIGLRKALAASERRALGLSVSRTASNMSDDEIGTIETALTTFEPQVTGELHDSGVKQLRNKRHAKRLGCVASIIASPDLHFKLIAFDRLGPNGLYVTPVYRACSGIGSFAFRNIPWQSGGSGPEIL